MAGFEGIRRGTLSAQMRLQGFIDELKNRGVTNDNCPRCNVFDWSVDFLEIAARPAIANPTIPPQPGVVQSNFGFAQPVPLGFLSMACIACRNCGYTMFHNLNLLETQKQK
jgi:hypothetical protein